MNSQAPFHIRCRYATTDEYPVVREFIDRHWATNHVYVKSRKLFDWTFGRHDVWDGDGYSVVLAEHDGAIAGMLGAIPFVFNCHGEESRAVWLVNYVLRPEYRRGASALQLLKALHRAPFATQVAYGNDPAVVPLYRAVGFRIPPAIPRHLALLANARARTTELLRLTHSHWCQERAESLAREFEIAPDDSPAGACATQIPSGWDERDWPVIAAQTVGAARNLAYLTWRYSNHPSFSYRVLALPEGPRTGLLVWRLETIQRRTERGTEPLDRMGRIVEFLPASRRNARALLRCLFRELAAADAFGADYYGFHGETRIWMTECGFRDVAEHPDGAAVPSRFQPLDGRGGEILSAVRTTARVPPPSVGHDCAWYWTKSDSDQDRPN
jgi:hypothetical protein